jgi:hypothetical protein
MSNEAKKTTEIPKSEKTDTAFPQNLFASFDPMAYWTQSQQTFQKLASESYNRAHSFADQYAALEAQMIARAQAAIASWAQLAQDAIAYGAQLSSEARKMGVETVRKMSAGAQ